MYVCMCDSYCFSFRVMILTPIIIIYDIVNQSPSALCSWHVYAVCIIIICGIYLTLHKINYAFFKFYESGWVVSVQHLVCYKPETRRAERLSIYTVCLIEKSLNLVAQYTYYTSETTTETVNGCKH